MNSLSCVAVSCSCLTYGDSWYECPNCRKDGSSLNFFPPHSLTSKAAAGETIKAVRSLSEMSETELTAFRFIASLAVAHG